jgi:chromosomal replication initiator protein
MYLTRDLTGAPYQDIGRAFGKRDHGTVMYACRKVEEKNNVDPKATEQLRALLRILNK